MAPQKGSPEALIEHINKQFLGCLSRCDSDNSHWYQVVRRSICRASCHTAAHDAASALQRYPYTVYGSPGRYSISTSV